MSIGDKTFLAKLRGPQMPERTNVNGSKPGKDTDSITILKAVSEIYWLAVNQNEVHFRVWHTNGFNRIFDRPNEINVVCYSLRPHLGRKKVIQLRVKSDANFFH